MGYLDLKISRILAHNRANRRHERLKKLMARKSPPAATNTSESDITTENDSKKSLPKYMNRKLKEAVEDGDVERFITTLEKVCTKQEMQLNTILEQRDSQQNTYLHLAANSGRCELIGLLMTISSSELYEKINDEGDTALHIAAKAGSFAVIDLLIRCCQQFFGDSLYRKNNKGNLPLHEVLLHNHQHLFDLFLHSCEDYFFHYVNNEGKSAFYLSVEAGNAHAFNAMLKADWTSAEMDEKLDEHLMKGRSLIHAALSRKDKAMLQGILAKGLQMLLYVKDEKGLSPIEFAYTIGFHEGIDLLRDELSKDTTDNGDICVNQQVLEQTPDALSASVMMVEEQDEEGVIRSADWDVRHERMRKLLRNEMLPLQEQQQQGMSNRCMDFGLYKAAKKGDVDEFITALERYSMEQKLALPTIFSQLTPLKNTYLHVASRHGHKDLSWLIIQYFPRLLISSNSHGYTALHLAAKNGKLDVVKILINFRNRVLRTEIPMDINLHVNDATYIKEGMHNVVENDDGRTPLQLAHKHYQRKVVDFFIKEHVEEVYHVNKKGTSLLYMVILNGEIEKLKDIFNTVSHYVDQNVLDDQLTKGKSLLLAAIWRRKLKILQELARQKPVLFQVKDEHAQKLVHFAELLGFHEGANYLRSEMKLEIVLDSVVNGNIPKLPVHSYSLDAYSLSIIEKVDQKIKNIGQMMHQNGRDERMTKLLCTNSIQQTHDENHHEHYMDIMLYEAAKKGDVDSFIAALENISEADSSSLYTISEQRTHMGNTFLHVAASCGNEDLTSFIVFYFRNLLVVKNKKGNTAIHEAARAGHLAVLDVLVRFNSYDDQLHSFMQNDPAKKISKFNYMWLKNIEGNTSFHEAFVHNHRHVIEYLIKSSVEEACLVNREGKSGLYLAMEAGMDDVVKSILHNVTSDVNEKLFFQFTVGKSLINAAIKRRSIAMLQDILRKIPSQIHVIDEDGQTPLFYAVSTGFLEGVNCLLDEFKMDTSQMDSSAFYLVHVASRNGHIHILQKLMQNLPDAGWFKNRKGQNILHVAAMYGKNNVVRFILQTPDLDFLINERDHDGNTPLHLATLNWQPKVVSSLTWNHQVNLNVVNKDGLMALDAAEECMEPTSSFQRRLTWSALMSAGTPKAVVGNARIIDTISSTKHDLSGKDTRYSMDHSKDRVNTLLLVATLVATVTFAAGFTMPGGYNNSEPKQGQATLLPKLMLQIFVICDAIALYSSIMVAVTLIWAQLGDLTLVVNALSFALPLLGLSLATMSIAFMVGVSLVVSNLTWLANFVLIFGIMCLASVLTLFIPLCLPYSSTSPVLRYITYYPFHMLVWASGSSDIGHIKEN